MTDMNETVPYTIVQDLMEHQDIPDDGILTRTILDNDDVKVVLFTFSENQELSEHTASMPAVLHFIRGSATLSLGEDTFDARPGTWVHMPPKLKHSIRAETQVVMLLLLLKRPDAADETTH